MYRCENCNATFDDSSELQKCLMCGGSLVKKVKQEPNENSRLKSENTPTTKSTKECPKCKTEIPKGASKCPNCQSDIRSWFRRHPILTLLMVLFALPFVMVSLLGGGGSKNTPDIVEQQIAEEQKAQEKQLQEIQAEKFHEKGENLNQEAGDVFLKNTIFKKSHLEDVGNGCINLELTVADSWYYLADFEKERLLEDAWQAFNMLAEKHDLKKEDEAPWKVIFVDSYGKRLTEKGWW